MKSSFFEVLKGIREKGQSSADIYVLNWIDFIYDLFDIVHHLVHRFCDICEWNGQKLQVKVSKCCHYHPCWEEQYKTFFHLCVTNYQLPTYYEHPLIHHSTLEDPQGVAVRQPRSATVAGLHHPPPQQCRTWDALGKRCKGTMNILQGPPCVNIKAKEILNWAIATISVEITQIPAWQFGVVWQNGDVSRRLSTCVIHEENWSRRNSYILWWVSWKSIHAIYAFIFNSCNLFLHKRVCQDTAAIFL